MKYQENRNIQRGTSVAEECVFCQIGAGQISSHIIHSDDTYFVIRDISPKAPIHLLVIPKEHVDCVSDLTSDQYMMFEGLFRWGERAADMEGLSDSGYRLVINNGRDAGQQVNHIHLHVLGGKILGKMC